MGFFGRKKGKTKSGDQGTSSASMNESSVSASTSADAGTNNDMKSVSTKEASNKKANSVSGGGGGDGSSSNNSIQSNKKLSNSAEDSVLIPFVPTVDSSESARGKLISDSSLTKATFERQSSSVNKDTSAVSMDQKEVDYDVSPTLLYKFIEQGEWEEALERCKVAPEEASTWVVRHEWKNKNADECIDYENDTDKVVRWRMLPIHSAIIFKGPLELVKAVLEAYPEGIHGPDDRKMLPIHLCCRHITNMDVAKYLITTDKESLTRTDYKGRTPFTILKELRYKYPRKNKNKEKLTDEEKRNLDELIKMIEDLKIIQRSNIDNDSREVDYDMTPTVLIKLIERKMWKQAINRCEDYPEEAATWMCRLQEVKEQDGGLKDVKWKILPIHSAIILHSPVEVIETLIDAYPQGLRKGDDRKMLPLHMAFRIGASLDVTAVLVDAYPDALKKRDIKGHTPIHILKAYERKYEKEKRLGNDNKEKDTFADKNRKRLIKFYLRARKYGDDDDETLAPYDSEGDSSDNSDDDSTIFLDDDDDEHDGLFYGNMLNDIGAMAVKGLTALPGIVRDTFTCRT